MTEPAMVGIELQDEVLACADCDYPHLCPIHAAACKAMPRGEEISE